MYHKVLRSVEYVQRRFADALNGIDSRFALRDVEQAMTRDGYLAQVEHFVSDGSVTCLYCLVAEQLLDVPSSSQQVSPSPPNRQGAGGSSILLEDTPSNPLFLGTDLSAAPLDKILFVPRIANVTAVATIIYALRLPSSSDQQGFCVDDILFGCVQNDPVEELADIARSVLLPIQTVTNQQYVAAAQKEQYDALHPNLGSADATADGLAGTPASPSRVAASPTQASVPVMQHLVAPIPAGYANPRAVEKTDAEVRRCVRHISTGLDNIAALMKDTSTARVMCVNVEDTAPVLQRVSGTPVGIAKAAQDPAIAADCEALVVKWIHALRTTCNRDGLCGFGATSSIASLTMSHQGGGGGGGTNAAGESIPTLLQPRRPAGPPSGKGESMLASSSSGPRSSSVVGPLSADAKSLLLQQPERTTYNFQLVPETFGPLAELSQWKDTDIYIRGQLDVFNEPEIDAVCKIVGISRPATAAVWEATVDGLRAQAEEARSCIKYLTTIERHINPIYGTDLVLAKTAMPDLVKNIATLHRVVPYYTAKHHLRLMIQSVSHQIITCSKNAIRRPGRLWEQTDTPKQIEVEVELFYSAIALSRSFQDELSKEPTLKEGLDELAVFGRLELFCSRLVKLADLFSTTLVFRNLELYAMDGVESILNAFFNSLDDLRRKSGDSLDYTKPSFDSDYLEFKRKVSDVDCSLQVLVNSCFENVPNVTAALELLHKFNVLVQRPSLRADLQAKYLALFQRYGLELESVQRVYEMHKADPPLARNSPPVAGRIAWARQLLPRIEEPMKVFQASQALVAHQRDTTKIIRLYNRIALALTEYEAFWTQAWVKTVPISLEGVRATLLIKQDDRYLVNFDNAIVELVREAKWLHRMGIELPAGAMELVRLRSLLPLVQQLQFTMDWTQRTVEKIIPKHVPAMRPLVQELESVLAPGLTSITWNAASVMPFIHQVRRAVLELETRVDRINAVVEKRISAALLAASELLILPNSSTGEPFSVDELLAAQEECAAKAAASLAVTNATVREAVTDVCRLVDPDWSPANREPSPDEPTLARMELSKLYQYYNRLFFRSVLHAVVASLTALKKSMGTLIDASFILCGPNQDHGGAFLKLAVDLAVPHVVVQPQVEDIQHAVNTCVQLVLNCASSIGDWPGTRSAYQNSPTPFLEEISKNKETIKVVLQLAGTVLGVHQYVDDFLKTIHRFSALWSRDSKAVVAAFAQSERPRVQIEEELLCCDQLMAQVQLIQDQSFVGCFLLDCLPLKKALCALCLRWKEAYAGVLQQAMDDRLNALLDKTEYLLKRTTQQPPVDFGGVQEELAVLDSICVFELHMEAVLLDLQDCCAALDKYLVGNSTEHQDRMLVLRNKWRKLHFHAHEKRDAMSRIQHIYKKDVIDATNKFGVEMICFRNDFEVNGPLVDGITPNDAIERLKRFQRVLQDKMRRWQTNCSAMTVLGFQPQLYPQLARTARDIHNASMLYDLYQAVMHAVSEAKRTLWSDVQYEKLVQRFSVFLEDVLRLPSEMKGFSAFGEMKTSLESFIVLQPLIEQLSHRSIRERHWEHVMKLCGTSWDLDSTQFRLESIIEANLMRNADEIMDLTVASEKEAELEHRLKDITQEWRDKTMTFAAYKHRGLVTLKPEETGQLKEQLDETLVILGSIVASKYVAPFRAEATLWCSRLTLVGETLNSFLEVQSLWMYLEAVFSTGDIMKQLPADAKRFSIVDKQWVKIFAKAREMPNALDFGNGSEAKTMGYLRDQLELCQRSLTTYLEQKRNAFARFFFVSDSILLEILAQGSDPSVMQPHFSSMFDGLSNVVLEQAEDKRTWKVVAMRSAEQELVPLSEHVICEGVIEGWLQKLCLEMQRSIRLSLREAVSDAMSIRADPVLQRKFLFLHPAQVVLTTLQIQYTLLINDALNGKLTDRKDVPRRLSEAKDLLTEQARLELTPFQRTHIQTLITMAVHNLEVWDDTVKRAKDVQSFEWQRQVRYYWTDKNECVLRIADAELAYSYEYLGIKERLVVTPLTDRCYTTLSQALTMYMGGAPVGPAGTGKTETVKDLGRAAGKYVVVFNCGEQWDVRALGKIFRGLAQAGCWGCFDEFNRISLSVLSVVSQQLHTIFLAQKLRKKEFVFADGLPCGLVEGTGVFVTMNPEYAGRQELPQNLKAMFRSVSMMAPDKLSIVKTKLAASGYKLDKPLSKKFCLLYDMCEQQLSKQQQYDFGLRNILSVLRAAGEVLRQSTSKDEESVFMRCVRDMNLSKLVHGDVPVFLSLLSDIFPLSIAAAEKVPESDMRAKIRFAADELGYTSCTGWLAKCSQLYETKLVRHGVMIIGPAGGGKTSCTATLLRALSQAERRHKEVRMNPKAITAEQMFGVLDATTGDWTDGIFSSLWRTSNRERTVTVWLVCDGPIDTCWVESLNTVLDDNKLLTLANGDRIAMSPTLKMCFEAEDLRNASPATVSRAGIVFLSMEEVGWEAVLAHRCSLAVAHKHWTAAAADSFVKLGKRLLKPLFTFISTSCKSYRGTPATHLVTRVVEVAHGLIKYMCEPTSKGEKDSAGSLKNLLAAAEADGSPSVVGGVFWYSAAWGLCGELDADDRRRFAEFVDGDVPRLVRGVPIFEQYVELERGTWVEWKKQLPAADLSWDPSLPFISAHGVFVPTLDSTILHALLASHVERGHPVLLYGLSGCSKTVTIEKLLRDISNETNAWKKLNISRSTTQTTLQHTIEDLCEKRMGSVYGPLRNRRLAFFVDDINMAARNEWGDQESCELMRQLLEFKGLYALDRIGEWKRFVDIKFIAAGTVASHSAASASGGGGISADRMLPCPPRLLRHFAVYNIHLPTPPTLELVLDTILRARFGQHMMLTSLVQPIVQASLTLWQACGEKLLPTPSRSHYSFSMRDLLAIAQGLLMLDVTSCGSAKQFLAVWVHESHRVLADRLSAHEDCAWFRQRLVAVWQDKFAATFGPFGNMDDAGNPNGGMLANFLPSDEDAGSLDVSPQRSPKDRSLKPPLTPLVDSSLPGPLRNMPKLYRPVPSMELLKKVIAARLENYKEHRGTRLPPLELVLYDSAVQHICRISRVLATPSTSMLLIGVGGSGKQTTARVAALLQDMPVAQPVVTAGYSVLNFLDDLRGQFFVAGVQGPTVMLITDNEIREEAYLDHVNAALASGDVAGLFNADEKDAVRNAIRPIAKRQARRQFEDSEEWLWNFFVQRVRTNLHFILCLSPQHDKFESRVRQFPSIMGSCAVDFFFPWPTTALVEVAEARLMKRLKFSAATDATRQALPQLLSSMHVRVQSLCAEYSTQGVVHATPELFLRLLPTYKKVYRAKEAELRKTYNNLVAGLEKLQQAGADVQKMRIELDISEKALLVATKQVSDLLIVISAQAEAATEQKVQVQIVTDTIAAEAAVIAAGREEAEMDLVAAQPALLAARQALDQITANDVNTLRAMRRPPQMIRRIFDGVCILLHERMGDVSWVMNGPASHLADSWTVSGRLVCSRPNLLDTLNFFNDKGKDRLNDETCELLLPYISQDDFTYERAKVASGNIAGLCTWVRAMVTYRTVSKFVAPKIATLARAEYKLRVANEKLAVQTAELAKAEATMAECVNRLNEVKADKLRLESDTIRTRRRLTYSSELIAALGDERQRWEQEERSFSQVLERLVGDTAAAAAFITYGGPFNANFRKVFFEAMACLIFDHRVPFSGRSFSFAKFMVADQQVTEWQLQSLPMDDHSVENAIIATQSMKPPLFLDTESQMTSWIFRHFLPSSSSAASLPIGIEPVGDDSVRDEADPVNSAANISVIPPHQPVTNHTINGAVFTKLTSPQFNATLEQQLAKGLPLVVGDVTFGTHPTFDSLLQFRIVKMAGEHGQVQGLNLLGVPHEYHSDFTLWLQTKSAASKLSPETFAAVTVIDASVTPTGLQQQLLSKVVMVEKKELEFHRQAIREELFANESKLRQIEVELLEKLSMSQGSLVDDESLILTLQHSKLSAEELKMKLAAATDTQQRITNARDEFAPVAERGALLYFVARELSSVNASYQLSLARLLMLFQQCLIGSQPSTNVQTRIRNIIESFSQVVFAFVGRGLLESHKPLFGLILTIRILIARGAVTQSEFASFLTGGTALDFDEVVKGRPKPTPWMQNHTWRHVSTLANHPRFATIRDVIVHNELSFKSWIESETPELNPIPFYTDVTPFEKLLLVRCFREDRTLPAVAVMVRDVLGPTYTEVPPFDLAQIVAEEAAAEERTPVLFLLTAGSDPTHLVEALAKKKRRNVSLLSLGQGQEPAAIALLNACAANGDWAVFQNCHLSPAFLRHLQGWTEQHAVTANAAAPAHGLSTGYAGGKALNDHAEFRLFLGSEPTDSMPLSLLQRCLVLTDEPPTGTAATIGKVLNLVPQDVWDASHRADWRACVYALCFYHTTVLERRKYGVKGWTAPYQFSEGDFQSSLMFLSSHFSTLGDDAKRGPSVSWEGIRYMIGDIHYGGRITRTNDRRTLEAITEYVFSPSLLEPKAMLCPDLNRFPVTTDISDVALWRSKILPQFGANEPPTVFGLNATAELSHRTTQAQQSLALLLSIQPQTTQPVSTPTSNGSSTSRESFLGAMLKQLSKKMPSPIEISRPSGTTGSAKLTPQQLIQLDPLRPMMILFAHEMNALNKVIRLVDETVSKLSQALSGTLSMTPSLAAVADSLFVSQVPSLFEAVSWSALGFASWLNMLQRRHDQIKSFLQVGDKPCFDIGAFFNPRGFLSVTRQEICRKRCITESSWQLEKVETKFSVTRLKPSDVERPPEEGAFISGMFLDGASWDIQRGRLRAPLPLELYHELPVMHVSASLLATAPPPAAAAAKAGTVSGALTPQASPLAVELAATTGYISQAAFRSHRAQRETEPHTKKVRLPCFTSPRRQEDGFLCSVDLLHDDVSSSVWAIRGVALLTATE